MKFKVGDKITLGEELLAKYAFRDCSRGTVYSVDELGGEYDWFIFRFTDDIGELISVRGIMHTQITLVSKVYDDATIPNFMGYKTVKDFENIIDYALAHGDVALFEECVNELKTRGLLESLTS